MRSWLCFFSYVGEMTEIDKPKKIHRQNVRRKTI